MSKTIIVVVLVLVIGGGIVLAVNFRLPSQPIDSSLVTKSGLGRYVAYTPQIFEEAKGKKRVYFFHAVWCPTCKVTNEELTSQENKIPKDVVIFKTDYDTSTDLKKQFGIAYQHTFVQVDESGNEISKWNGGGIDTLIQNLK